VLALTIVQGLWACLLGLVASYWLSRGGTTPGLVLFGLIALYVLVIISLQKRRPWAWWLCWIPPIVSLALAAPNVIYNVVLFVKRDPLYLDSPGTILIVAVNAILFVIPPLCVLVMLPLKRRLLSPNSALERTRGG
jgi:hypothetical protein